MNISAYIILNNIIDKIYRIDKRYTKLEEKCLSKGMSPGRTKVEVVEVSTN